MSNSRFCYTLDVLTDGSEHTGCGTLFLSVWKTPLSVLTAATAAIGDRNESLSSSSDSDTNCSSSASSESDSEEDEENEGGTQKEEPDDDNHNDNHHCHNNRATPESCKDPYLWLTAEASSACERHTPVARYAISGIGDATARLCADQRFKLAPTRACFVPDLSNFSAAADGLSSLFLALYGAGSPSLHVVVPASFARSNTGSKIRGNSNSNSNSDRNRNGNRKKEEDDSGGAFVEELATITLGAHKKFDIRTCEVRHPENETTDDSLTWWKVYEDEYLLVHASSSKGLFSSSSSSSSLAASALGSDYAPRQEQESPATASASSLVYLYSFPSPRGGINGKSNTKNSYCTLALLPPRCRSVADFYERLVRQSLPMVRDGVPMKTIDYAILLDPHQPFSSLLGKTVSDENKTGEAEFLQMAKRSRVLMTLPRNNLQLQDPKVDNGILIRSQQLHRHFHRRMPWAFVEPRMQVSDQHQHDIDDKTGKVSSDIFFVLKSGTSLVLEKSRNPHHQQELHSKIWDRRKSIWSKDLKEEWTKGTTDSLESFLGHKTPATDENEIEIKVEHVTDEPQSATDENEIELEDENEIDLDDDSDVQEEDAKDDNEIDFDEDDDSIEQKGNGNVPLSYAVKADNGVDDPNHHPEKLNTASRGHAPRLLVLGTGCATPSAYRGASGYALVLPPANDTEPTQRTSRQQYCYGNTNISNEYQNQHREKDDGDQIYLLDCGEGVSTMLSRNCGHIVDWTTKVRGIWISHAHLDHYGGLPTLLRILWKERELQESFAGANYRYGGAIADSFRNPKRPRHFSNTNVATRKCGDINSKAVPAVPWVVAPAKVLRYLDLVLDCRHGQSRDGKRRICFEPRLHHDPRIPNGPFFHFENIKVYHNCCPAFGLLIGWTSKREINDAQDDNSSIGVAGMKLPGACNTGRKAQFLCYSGDTRPSQNLVRACRRALQGCNQNYSSFNGNPRDSFSTANGRNSSNSNNSNHNHNHNRADLFLIHEATYRENESAMAYQKKHSTLSEAQMVATDIGCSRVLMSHFSQRYDNVAASTKNSESTTQEGDMIESVNNNNKTATAAGDSYADCNKPVAGLAVDGLWISLDH